MRPADAGHDRRRDVAAGARALARHRAHHPLRVHRHRRHRLRHQRRRDLAIRIETLAAGVAAAHRPARRRAASPAPRAPAFERRIAPQRAGAAPAGRCGATPGSAGLRLRSSAAGPGKPDRRRLPDRRPGCALRHLGAGGRRLRNREGTPRARDPPRLGAYEAALRRPTAARCPISCSNRSSWATGGAPSPVPTKTGSGCSHRRAAAPCSSTRSARPPRPSS